MPDFKGFEDWVEIFRGGEQTDSMGRRHDGDELIDKAVASFDAARHEPPLVIGHPKENAPAWGWVAELKSGMKNNVKSLLARFRQVQPEFEELVKAGRYKKRSASFYPDGSLRHVGFLGAAPPAVKGLADVGFAEAGAVFEFGGSEWAVARIFRRLREWLIEKDGVETADRIVGDWEINDIQRDADQEMEAQAAPFNEKSGAAPLVGPTTEKKEADMPDKSFTEADMAAAVAKAKKDGKEEAAAEFAEKEKGRMAAERRAQVDGLIQGGVKDGRILPAWVAMGLADFMAGLDAEEEISFSEDGGKKSHYAWFADFLAKLPKLVEFRELARKQDDHGDGNAGVRIDALISAKMKGNNQLTYAAAFTDVQAEQPELAAEYQQELQTGG